MIGNFRHPPNPDGIRWLKARIWPRIRAALPGAEVHIYGAYPSREMMELDAPADGFRVRGPVASAVETLEKYRVALAPLRFGAGIKGKILDAWAAGTPVVTTPIGAEGMMANDAPEGAIAGDEEAFARAAIRLHTEGPAWTEASRQGRRILDGRFGYARQADALIPSLLDF